jgi:hypothetical protein
MMTSPNNPRASARLTKGRKTDEEFPYAHAAFSLSLHTTVMAQNETASTSNIQPGTKQGPKRGPVFRATKEQINQAQALLKTRGFYTGEQLGKLDDATREGLRKYQQAE